MKISEIEPKLVMKYFEEICNIPHGSGNTKQISDYCAKFAEDHGYKYIQDKLNNIIIFCPATKGYEESEPVIMQGHLDMVCDNEPWKDIDMSKEGVTPIVDGDFIKADGTTLGSDDGIAIAYTLAIMASSDIDHPPIEAVFTVDEEVGMGGASGLDVSALKGRIMLNIDSEAEGILTVSCAGGANARCSIPIERSAANGYTYEIIIDGLIGGHSGMEINSMRANANILMGRLLYAVKDKIRIVSLSGGVKGNAIAQSAKARIIADSDISGIAAGYENIFKNEFSVTDANIRVSCIKVSDEPQSAVTAVGSGKIAAYLMSAPNGIYAMSADIDGLVQTSLNLGILKLENDEMTAEYTIRSSMGTQKQWIINMLTAVTESLGGKITISGSYAEWEYRKESRLRELMRDVYIEMYGAEPKIEAIHAGVECGIFAGKLPGLDCVSFGPDLLEIHTVRERMNIASVQRVWKYIIEILKRLK